MYGRLGGMYYLHLAEANAQRRRLAQPEPELRSRSSASEGLAVFLRLFGVMGIGFGAIATLAIMVG